MLAILRCLQAGLKCSNSFDKGKKGDQSPQPNLFTTSFFVGEVIFTQQYCLAHAGWRHSSHWSLLCPFPPPTSSQLISQFMAGCSSCVLISPHLSLSAYHHHLGRHNSPLFPVLGIQSGISSVTSSSRTCVYGNALNGTSHIHFSLPQACCWPSSCRLFISFQTSSACILHVFCYIGECSLTHHCSSDLENALLPSKKEKFTWVLFWELNEMP